MLRYITKRLFMMLFVLLGVIIMIFLLLYFVPGDPARMILGYNASEAEVEALRTEMGLDQPMLTRLANYLGDLFFRFDIGTSYMTHRPVFQEIMQRFPTTLLLTFLSVAVSLVIGIPTGIISAVRQYTIWDKLSNIIGVIGVSVPNFWLGLELSLLFALRLHWLPASGFSGPIYWILPAITVGVNGAASVMRMTRSSMLEVIRSDYIRMARAKGQSEFRVIMHHALRNALIPIITVVGMQIGTLLGGTMVVESVFSVPGMGNYLVSAINRRDYPVVQGGVLIVAIAFSMCNLLVDILYAYVDPRIKSQYQSNKKRIAFKKGTVK